MSRNVPALLAAYMAGNGIHIGYLTKVGPLPDGTYRYFSHQSSNYTYDDGDGPQTYIARTGMQLSAFVSSADLGVDNAEVDTLPVVDGYPAEGFTAEQVKRGLLDAVPYVTYFYSYLHPEYGHAIWSGGNLGEQRIKGTALFNIEQRSITNKFKQTIGQVDSTTCRARFGSQSAQDSSGELIVERQPCGYDISVEWVPFTVTAVHPTDTDLVFYSDDLNASDDYFRPGMVKWTTGDNVGQEREVGGFGSTTNEQTITLGYGLPYPVQIGDTGEIRRGCTKFWSGHNSCETFWGGEKPLHFRGEPHIPVGDASGNLISGAGVHGDVGGTGEFLPPNDPGLPGEEPPGGGAGNGSSGNPTLRSIGADTEDACAHGADPSAPAADNSTAINAAFAALAGGGGTVYFSVSGTYQINTANPITLDRNNSRLTINNVTLQAAYTSTVTAPANHRDVVRVDGADEWEIVGGHIIGYLDAWITNGGTSVHGVSEWAHGIYVTDSTAGTIKDVTIDKCVGDAISLGRTASDVVVDNCLLSDCRRQGISTGSDDVTITNNEIYDIGARYGTSPMAGIDVEVDSPESAANILIQGNDIHDTRGPNILCWLRTSNVDILDNVLRRGTFGILAHGSTGGTVQGNTIEYAKYHGAKFESNADTWTVGGVGNENSFGGNYTSLNGTVTTGNTKTLTGESTATRDHIYTSDDSTVTVGQNFYRPA